MTTYYVNPATGNDAADGLTWGTAWRTLLNGATFARMGQTDSDEIRIAKSPDPVSIGNMGFGFWVSGSAQASTSLTNILVDDCESGWTAGLVTPSHQTSIRRTGNASVQVVMSATTGKVAFRTLPSTLDLSQCTRLTFWVRFNVNSDFTLGSQIVLDLCSDMSGDTIVNRVPLPSYFYPANHWCPITVDTGVALGNTINSVAIRTLSAQTRTMQIDHIVATRPHTDPTSLTLNDLIAPNDGTGRYTEVRSVAGTILPSSFAAFQATTTMSYMSAQQSSYRIEPTTVCLKRACFNTADVVPASLSTSAVNALNYTNASDFPATKTYIGGVNTVTDLVDGESWFDGITSFGQGFIQTNIYTGSLSIDRVGAVRYFNNFRFNVNDRMDGTNLYSVNSASSDIVLLGAGASSDPFGSFDHFKLSFNWIGKANASSTVLATTGAINTQYIQTPENFVVEATHIAILGVNSFGGVSIMLLPNMTFVSTGDITFTGIEKLFQPVASTGSSSVNKITLGNVRKTVLAMSATGPCLFGYPTSTSPQLTSKTEFKVIGSIEMQNGAYGTATLSFPILAGSLTGERTLIVDFGGNGVLQPNIASSSGIAHITSATGAHNIVLKNVDTLPPTVQLNSGAPTTPIPLEVRFENVGRVAGDNRIYNYNAAGTGTAQIQHLPFWRQQTAVTYAGSSAFEYHASATASNLVGSLRQIQAKIGTVVVKEGIPATISMRIRRTSTNIRAGFVVYGISSDMPAGNTKLCTTVNVWELVEYTFTPASAGAIEVVITANIFTTAAVQHSAYFDDLQITQA